MVVRFDLQGGVGDPVPLDEQRAGLVEHGVQQVVVTTRPASAQANADPFERPDPVEPETVHVERGPFRDVEASQTMTVWPAPALWGQNRDVAFTVSGDLTSAQLLRVAESLR